MSKILYDQTLNTTRIFGYSISGDSSVGLDMYSGCSVVITFENGKFKSVFEKYTRSPSDRGLYFIKRAIADKILEIEGWYRDGVIKD